MTEETKVSLSVEDWANLVPTTEVPIASQKVKVWPLGFEKLRETIVRFEKVQKDLSEQGVTLDNAKSPKSVIAITSSILQRVPEVIADSTNLDIADIKRLPVNVALILVEAILDANIASQEGFIKNLTALASKAARVMNGVSAT